MPMVSLRHQPHQQLVLLVLASVVIFGHGFAPHQSLTRYKSPVALPNKKAESTNGRLLLPWRFRHDHALASKDNGDNDETKDNNNVVATTSNNNSTAAFSDRLSAFCKQTLSAFSPTTMSINNTDTSSATATTSSSSSTTATNTTTPAPLVFSVVAQEWWSKIKWSVASFVVGLMVAGAALIVPIYNDLQILSSQTTHQPVTLFETILQDLDQAYVDPVDTNKLFETGVAAMLRSLDPYTEFEGKEEAVAMAESIDGRYGGVGLVIAGSTGSGGKAVKKAPQILPDAAQQDNQNLLQQQQQQQVPPEAPLSLPTSDSPSSTSGPIASAASLIEEDNAANDDDEDYDYIALDEDEDEEDFVIRRQQEKMRSQRARERGIRVVSAFEGYAFDYGMRVGDKLLAVDDVPITPGTSVEQVRNSLRGEPGTMVTIKFERDGVDGVQSVTMPRTVVRVRDVKLATLVGDPVDGIGYIQLSGFASDTGREMRSAIQYLQRAAEDASDGQRSLQGLVLDMRGNPGGLLTSAVDVCSLLLPKNSDIVSAQGRGFPALLYRSRVDPILDSQTKLAVLVNGNTASAAEIVSGAIQDLDVGVIVGGDRTFGKGLVQSVETLPFETALKFTVAKYYTPSGRCIQGVKYQEGGGLKESGRYVAKKVTEKDRSTFFTRNGRVVRDGGGIEADYKVPSSKASPLEITLLRSGLMNEFAAHWSKNHELTDNFQVDEGTYKEFQAFVAEKQKNGEIDLGALYSGALSDLKKTLKASGYTGAEKSVDQLQARIVREIQNDFNKYRKDIKEDISTSILARYIPESMLIERGIKTDVQVNAAVMLLRNDNQYNKLLARDMPGISPGVSGNSINMAIDSAGGATGSINW